MYRSAKYLALTALVVLSTLQVATASEINEFKTAIRAKYDLKEKAFADGVAAPIVQQFYSEDVLSVDNEGNTHSGREELWPLYEEVTKHGKVKIKSVSTSVSGDRGWDWANFVVTPRHKDAAPFSFKILFLWEKVGDEWWCAGDMFVLGNFDNDE